MYETFFQLSRAPFSLVSDPGCIHVTPAVKDVMRHLIYGVLEHRGCLSLTSEPGLGKTTLLRALCDFLVDSNARSSTVAAPSITSAEFLEAVMLDFGLKEIPVSKASRLKILEDFLIRTDAEGRVSALIIDEAHTASDEVLEEIRLLSNFETESRKLLQIVIAGQAELDSRLNRPAFWPLKQRLATRLKLSRLDHASVAGYVRFRWAEAGTSPCPFTGPGLDALAVGSKGVPRVINVICHTALQIAFSQASRVLDRSMISDACAQLDLPAFGLAHITEPPLPAASSPEATGAVSEFEQRPPARRPAAATQAPRSRWFGLRGREVPRSAQSKRKSMSILSLDDQGE